MTTQDAITRAWTDYRDNLLAYIKRRVDHPQDAEDILNSVFEKLIASQRPLPDNIAAWLYKVTQNRIIDYYRSRKPAETLEEEISGQQEPVNLPQDFSRCVAPLLQLLPQEYYMPLLLCDLEGKSQREAAQQLDISLAALKSRILRGREMFAQQFQRCCQLTLNDSGEVIDIEQSSPDACGECGDAGQ